MWYDEITQAELDNEIKLVLAEMEAHSQKLDAMTEEERDAHYASLPEVPEDFVPDPEKEAEWDEIERVVEKSRVKKKSYTLDEVLLNEAKMFALYRLKNRVLSK
jgi:seryl-tRNA synthetase